MTSANVSSWRQLLTQAVELHQANRLQDAIAIYRDVLNVQPDNGDALHLLGMALEQDGAPDEGLAFIERAIAADPQIATYRNSLGNIYRALNDTAAAAAAYGEALRLDPRSSEAHNNLGLLRLEQEDWPAATAHFQAALQLDSAFTAAAFNLIVTYWHAGQRDAVAKILPGFLRVHPAFGGQVAELGLQAVAKRDIESSAQILAMLDDAGIISADRYALAAMAAELREDDDQARRFAETALTLQSTHLRALDLLARLALRREDFQLAVQLLDRLMALEPDGSKLRIGLAYALINLRDYDRAVPLLRQLTAEQPDSALLMGYLAQALNGQDALDEACVVLRKAIALDPDNALMYANLASFEAQRNNLDEAERLCQMSLERDPDCAVALDTLGNLRTVQGCFGEAEALFRRAIEIKPLGPNAHCNLSYMLLRQRRYAEAWPHYAWRWKKPGVSAAGSLGLPAWDGITQPSGRLLVWREQGVGDQILYASLIGDLMERGIRVVIATEPRLIPLFSRSFPGVTVLDDATRIDPAALGLSHQCPVGDLAGWLRRGPADFARQPAVYLRPDATRRDRLRARYAADDTLLLGLSWSSSKARKASFKSVPLDAFAPFLNEPGLRAVSLQYGDAMSDIARSGLPVIHDTEIDPLASIDAQVAQISALDMVVTVSTAAAHLAAALGKPTLILLPEAWGEIWYWGIEGDQTPWYPTVRICRAALGEDRAGLANRALTMFRAMRAALPPRQAGE